METKNTIITNGKKLTARIGEVTRSLKTQCANIQILLESAIWHGFGHGSNGFADTLVRNMPERLQGPVKSYLLEFGPFVYDSKTGKISTKKGTKPCIATANEKTADLPNWETFKKAKDEKPMKAASLIKSLATKINVALKDGKVDENEVSQANALLSYLDNIQAGLTKEKMLADAQIAMREAIEQEYKAREQMDMAADASIQTQQVLADIAEKQAA